MLSTSQKEETSFRFTNYPASKRLAQLAQKPYDLTKPGNLTPERIAKLQSQACGYKFLYAFERVDDEVMKALAALAEEAAVIDKMHHMQSGEPVNRLEGFPSENRPVLHTALRDFFDSPNQAPVAKAAADKARKELERLKVFIEKIDREKKFTNLVSIAIGGSDLGPRALTVSLRHLERPDHKVHFFSNVDPDDAAMTLRKLDLKKTLIVVVSKSGTTIETVTNEELARDALCKAGLKPEEHVIAVTAEGSPMDDRTRYLECFHMWDWVGGRFSGTSMGGALTLGFAYGYDVLWELLKGANAMDKVALQNDLKQNLPLLGALLSVWNHNFLHYPTLAFIPYSEALLRFAAHIQQVEMESNGKRIDRHGREVPFETGPIIWGEPGTNAQHSFYQLIHQGTATIPLEFVGFKESVCGRDLVVQGTTSQEKLLSNLFAQAIALATGQDNANPNKVFPGNRPSHILLCKKLTPYALGALFAYVEHKVAFEGFIWDINSFDQEGVQLGKVLANKVMGVFANNRDSAKAKSEPFPLGQALIDQLTTLP